MKPISFAAGLAALALAATAQPATAQTQAPPPPTEPRPFTLPEVSSYKLANGIEVTTVPFGRVPKVAIIAAMRAGNANEGEHTWLADMTTELMKKSADGLDASGIAEKAAAMGSSFSLASSADITTATMDVLADSAPEAIALIADVLRRPDFPAEELEKVRADLLRSLSVARSSPGSIAGEAYNAVLYPDHPYGRTLPTQEQLAGYTLDQVRAFHEANYGAARTQFYIVGQFDEAAVRQAIESEFGDWKQGPEPLDIPAAANPPPQVVLIDRPGAPQSTVRIGKRVTPPGEELDLLATNTLLGGYFSSRITQNIREDKGYTYSPGSGVGRRVEGTSWTQQADITSEATGPAITEIFKEIRRMRSEPPSPQEVQGIQNYMNGTFVMSLANRGGVAGNLANLDLLGLGPDYLNSYVDRVRALTPADLQQAAAKELSIDDISVVVVGPLDSVRPQLAAVPELAGRLPD